MEIIGKLLLTVFAGFIWYLSVCVTPLRVILDDTKDSFDKMWAKCYLTLAILVFIFVGVYRIWTGTF